MSKATRPALARRGSGICASSTFQMPTRAEFGRGIVGKCGEEARSLSHGNVLVVTDPGVHEAGLCEPVLRSLREAGLRTTLFDHVQGNPRDVHCMEGADIARDLGVALVLGVGGGSAIDTAKCIALLLTNGGHPRDWEDFGALREAPLPTFAIPTTAGTGSEVSLSAIITDWILSAAPAGGALASGARR